MLITFQINREARLGLTHQSPQRPESKRPDSRFALIFASSVATYSVVPLIYRVSIRFIHTLELAGDYRSML